MKKLLFFITCAVIFFTGCNTIIVDKDAFDFRDTVDIAIGEKLYENKNLWVRLDSITEDSRCPEGMMCFWEGRVVAWFSVGTPDTLVSLMFATDTLRSRMFSIPWASAIYWMTIIDVTPERVVDEVIPQQDYRIYFVLEEGAMVYKPNIYLYPEKTTKLDVDLEFPHGGNVTVSDPSYPEAWQNIIITPDGKIDKKHEFLFYEAQLPDLWQYGEGWVLRRQHLPLFFTTNLEKYGFNEREIHDFMEYWIPRLKDAPYYAIYPQHTAMVNQAISLDISQRPDALLRLFYVIEDMQGYFALPEPDVPEFTRKGFTVTEWGVIW